MCHHLVMARPLNITAYGKVEDRLKLAAIASAEQKSGSEVIVDFIRQRYAELFGDLDPSLTVPGE